MHRYILATILLMIGRLHATDIEDYIDQSMAFWHVPGASIAIVKDGQVVLAKGFGYKKLEKTEGNRVNDETLFPIASLTKSFTAAAGQLFVEEQKITFDQTIQSLWPSFKLADTYATAHLTLRDCLSMRAGLTGPAPEASWWTQKELTEKGLLESLAKVSFPYGFRGRFVYDNLLYSTVGEVIEKKTGKTWGEFVQLKLLDPLGMKATTTMHADFLAVENKAYPHQGMQVKEVPFEQLDVIAPGAGLASNAKEMSKWLLFLLDNQKRFHESFTSQTVAKSEMFFPKGEAWMEKIFFPQSHFLTYGMGWFIHDYKGIVVYQDPGLTDGMNGLMALIPELNLGIVVLSNLEAPFFSHSLLFHLIDQYRGEITSWDKPFLEVRKSAEPILNNSPLSQ